MAQMYLTLPSNSSEKYFPDNTLSHFTTRLHMPIRLPPGEWEVGLAEIQYPHSWLTIRNRPEARIGVYFLDKNGDAVKKDNEHIDYGFYKSLQELVDALNAEVGRYVTFKLEKNSQQISAVVKERHMIELSAALQEITMLPQYLQNDYPRIGHVMANTRRGIDSIYVYCDLVEHQLVGDTQVPLLRIVPVKGNIGESITKTFNHIQYLAVRGGEAIQTVEIEMRDDIGRPITFENGRVVVVLHLRKIQFPYL